MNMKHKLKIRMLAIQKRQLKLREEYLELDIILSNVRYKYNEC